MCPGACGDEGVAAVRDVWEQNRDCLSFFAGSSDNANQRISDRSALKTLASHTVNNYYHCIIIFSKQIQRGGRKQIQSGCGI